MSGVSTRYASYIRLVIALKRHLLMFPDLPIVLRRIADWYPHSFIRNDRRT
jgi:hypothetical protein